MSDGPSTAEKVRANAALVVSLLRDQLQVELTYDPAGVAWIDGYINRIGPGLTPRNRPGLVNLLGSFVGECIVRSYGGEWVEADGRWGVQVSERLWACPFAKVEKQLENGAEDSVLRFFLSIPTLDVHLARGSDSPLPVHGER